MNGLPQTQDRRVSALLAQAGLQHWRQTLAELFRRYKGLEDFTIGTNEGARSEVVHLLRQLNRQGIRLSDDRFAHAIADLGFLDYRVHRVQGDQITDERWNPNELSLSEFRAGGSATAYPVADRPTPSGMTARTLLCQVRRGKR